MASTLPPLHPAVETALADYYTASLAAIYQTPVPTPEELPDLYAPLVPGAPPLLSIPPGSPLAPARAIFDLLAPVSPASQAACVQNYLRDLPLNPTIYHCCACGDSTDASGVHGGVHPLSELHFSKFDPTCELHVEKMALYNALRALGEGREKLLAVTHYRGEVYFVRESLLLVGAPPPPPPLPAVLPAPPSAPTLLAPLCTACGASKLKGMPSKFSFASWYDPGCAQDAGLPPLTLPGQILLSLHRPYSAVVQVSEGGLGRLKGHCFMAKHEGPQKATATSILHLLDSRALTDHLHVYFLGPELKRDKFNDLCMLILRAELSLAALCTNQILASWQDCLCPHARESKPTPTCWPPEFTTPPCPQQ